MLEITIFIHDFINFVIFYLNNFKELIKYRILSCISFSRAEEKYRGPTGTLS